MLARFKKTPRNIPAILERLDCAQNRQNMILFDDQCTRARFGIVILDAAARITFLQFKWIRMLRQTRATLGTKVKSHRLTNDEGRKTNAFVIRPSSLVEFISSPLPL
jgi:hypothetical protein